MLKFMIIKCTYLICQKRGFCTRTILSIYIRENLCRAVFMSAVFEYELNIKFLPCGRKVIRQNIKIRLVKYFPRTAQTLFLSKWHYIEIIRETTWANNFANCGTESKPKRCIERTRCDKQKDDTIFNLKLNPARLNKNPVQLAIINDVQAIKSKRYKYI